MKYKIEWAYKIKGQDPVYFTSDWIDQESAILREKRLRKREKLPN